MDVSQAGQGGGEKMTGPCPLESASPGKLRSQAKEAHSTELSKEKGWKAAAAEG